MDATFALTSATASLAGETSVSFNMPIAPVASIAGALIPSISPSKLALKLRAFIYRRFEGFLQRPHVRADGGRNWKI